MAVEAYVQHQAQQGDMDMEEMPEMGNVPQAGNVPNQNQLAKLRGGANRGGGGVTGGTTESTQHPGLAGYDTLVNVGGDDE